MGLAGDTVAQVEMRGGNKEVTRGSDLQRGGVQSIRVSPRA